VTLNDMRARPDLAELGRAGNQFANHGRGSVLDEALCEACAPTPSARRLRAFAVIFAGWWREQRWARRRAMADEARMAFGVAPVVSPWPAYYLAAARFWALSARAMRREARKVRS
jgi:hypothetical protein